MAVDEGPSADDLDRFGDETGFCPDCGAEVWDGADRCPVCGVTMPDGPSSRPPVEAGLRRRWLVLIAVVAAVALILAILGWL